MRAEAPYGAQARMADAGGTLCTNNPPVSLTTYSLVRSLIICAKAG